MKIVITGASGFLGKELSTRLTHLGTEHISVSRKKINGFLKVDHYKDTPHGDVIVHLAEVSSSREANQYSS